MSLGNIVKDPEDEMNCFCYVLVCVGKNGKYYMDRTYINIEFAEKRKKYLDEISSGRGEWFIWQSELGN